MSLRQKKGIERKRLKIVKNLSRNNKSRSQVLMLIGDAAGEQSIKKIAVTDFFKIINF